MKPEKLYSLISDTNQLDETTLVELQELIKKYPYFQTLRILWNYNLAKLQNVQTSEYLKQTATFAGDRSKLLGLFQKTLHGMQSTFISPVFSKSNISTTEVQPQNTSATDKAVTEVTTVLVKTDEKTVTESINEDKQANQVDDDSTKTQSNKSVRETQRKEDKEDNDRFKPPVKESALDIAERKAKERQEQEEQLEEKIVTGAATTKNKEEKPTEKVDEKSAEKVSEKPTEKVDEKSIEKVSEKPTEKVDEKSTEKGETKQTLVENSEPEKLQNNVQDIEHTEIQAENRSSEGQVLPIAVGLHSDEKSEGSAPENDSDSIAEQVVQVMQAESEELAEEESLDNVARKSIEQAYQEKQLADKKTYNTENVELADGLKSSEGVGVSSEKPTPTPTQRPSYLGGSVQSRPMKEEQIRRVVSPPEKAVDLTDRSSVIGTNYYPVEENNLVSFFSEEPKLHAVSTQVEIDAPTITRPLSEEDVESFIQQEVIKMRADSTSPEEQYSTHSDDLNEEVMPGDFEQGTIELLDHEKMIDALIGNLRKVRDNGGVSDGGEDEIDRLLGETTFKKKNEAYIDILNEKPDVAHKHVEEQKNDLFEIENSGSDSVNSPEIDMPASDQQAKEYASGSLIELAIDALETMKDQKREAVIDFEIERNNEEVIELVAEEAITPDVSVLETPCVSTEASAIDKQVLTNDASVEAQITQTIPVGKEETVAERILRQVAEKRMKLRKEKDEADTVNQSEEEKKKLSPTNSRRNDQLLDRFIQDEPRLERAVPNQPQIDLEEARSSVQENEDIVTEAIANLYIAQKYYAKAISAYQKLSLKFPEKSTYFADQIENVKKLMNRE